MKVIEVTLSLVFIVVSAQTKYAASNEICEAGVCEEKEDVIKKNSEIVQDLLKWLLDKDVYIHPNLSIEPANSYDVEEEDEEEEYEKDLGIFKPGSNRLIAIDEIAEDELLISIPRESFISWGGQNIEEQNIEPECAVLGNFIEEIALGKNSTFEPYLNYLRRENFSTLPNDWSSNGKTLVMNIMNTSEKSLDESRHSLWKNLECTQKLANSEYFALAARIYSNFYHFWDEEEEIIPLVDMVTYVNSKNKINALMGEEFSEESTDYVIRASRIIEEGEEISSCANCCHFIYDEEEKEACEEEFESYDSFRVFRDYGIVEPFPQRWIFSEHNIGFTVQDDGYETSVEKIENYENKGREKYMAMSREYERLAVLKRNLSSEDYSATISQEENKIATALLDSALMAIGNYLSTYPSYCTAPDEIDTTYLYDMFDEHCDKDDLIFNAPVGLYGYENMEYIDYIDTAYQSMRFGVDQVTNNTCFVLGRNLQTCEANRPHYHSIYFHYVARFIKRDIKRVLFVGGGDSFILNDILEYPSIELVLGLEIDQAVTRQCFKWFGSQPHFNDNRVQWWYGDAAQTMKMIPKEYYGTFDVVLVDLSETKIADTVIIDMGVFGLLLRQDGILVKNEIYYKDISEMFRYTVQLFYDEVPLIAQQGFTLGSNGIDFLHTEPHDHGVLGKVVWPKYIVPLSYEPWYFYEANDDYLVTCAIDVEEKNKEIIDTELNDNMRQGILMVLEAEDVQTDNLTSEKIEQILLEVSKEVGFKIKSNTKYSYAEGHSSFFVTAVLAEGYIIARAFPDHNKNYCAFDIQLWGRFEKQDYLEKLLIKKLGSEKASSSYRLLSGGMYGLRSYISDIGSHGPKFTQTCPVPQERVKAVDDALLRQNGLMKDILMESFQALVAPFTSLRVGIVCGYHESELSCLTLEALKGTKSKELNLIEIWTCPSLQTCQEAKDICMHQCEEIIHQKLMDELGESSLDVLIFDSTASIEMASIIHKLLIEESNVKRLLSEENVLFLIPFVNESTHWQNNLAKKFLHDVSKFEPTYAVEVILHSTDPKFNSTEMEILSMHDAMFLNKLRKWMTTESFKSTSANKISAKIQSIIGGEPTIISALEGEYFSAKDYFHESAVEQWNSQNQVGLQTLFQFEVHVSTEKATDIASIIKMQKLSVSEIDQAVTQLEDFDELKDATFNDYLRIGSGSIHSVVWAEGNIIVVWDGKAHIDFNVFTKITPQNDMSSFQDSLAETFEENISKVKMVRDESQPRGYGFLVNSNEDVKAHDPLWVKPK